MRPDVVVILTDQERAAPPYETDVLREWRADALPGRRWFAEHGVTFGRHYTGSLACAPSRPTLFTGQYPDVHGVTQTDGLGKDGDDRACGGCVRARCRRSATGSVPPATTRTTRANGTSSHADLHDAATGRSLATNDDDGNVMPRRRRSLRGSRPARRVRVLRLDRTGTARPRARQQRAATRPAHGRSCRGLARGSIRPPAGAATRTRRPFLLVASFVNPHDIVFFPLWSRNDPFGDAHARSAPRCATAADRRRGSEQQAAGTARVPRRLPDRVRAAA